MDFRFTEDEEAFRREVRQWLDQEISQRWIELDPGIWEETDESWGLVLNEALACGLPIVVSDQVGACPDLVEEGMTGYSYPCGDIGELINALKKVREVGSGAREMAAGIEQKANKYSVEAASEGLLSAVQALRAPALDLENSVP